MTSDPHTIARRAANADVSGVVDHGVCDVERRATSTFSELASPFHGLCTSAVLLNYVEGSTPIDLRCKAKSSLAGTTTDRICVHDSQGDEGQRQKSIKEDHGTYVNASSEELVLNLKLS